MILRITQTIRVEVDDGVNIDDFTDSYNDTLLDDQDVICETSDGKFEYKPTKIEHHVKIEQVVIE